MILPVYAGLRADPRLAARRLRRPRRRPVDDVPARRPAARVPGGRRGLDLHVLADARRLHHAAARLELHAVHRQRRLRERRRRQQPAARRGVRDGAGGRHGRLPPGRAAARRVRAACDGDLSRGTRWLLRIGTALTLAFLYVAADRDRALRVQRARASQTWPTAGLHARLVRQGVPQPRRARRAVDVVKAGLGATAIALVLGTLAAIAVVALPLLRPRDDLVPGRPADRAAGHRHRHGAERDVHAGARAVDLESAVHGDRRPRDVLHRRRLQQRRRAAAAHVALVRGGVGRPRRPHVADVPATSRFPQMRSALVAGALLAFALRFDEVIVTTFTAGDQRDAADLDPHQPVAARTSCRSSTWSACVVIVLSIVPVWLAQRLTRDEAVSCPRRRWTCPLRRLVLPGRARGRPRRAGARQHPAARDAARGVVDRGGRRRQPRDLGDRRADRRRSCTSAHGRINWRLVAWMAPPSVVGAVAGGYLAARSRTRCCSA